MTPDRIQHRGSLAACAGAAVLALALARIPADSAVLSAARIALGFFVVGFAPGWVLLLAGGWARRLNGLAAIGLAAILSLALAQLLGAVALSLHVSCQALTAASVVAMAGTAATLLAGWRATTRPRVFWPRRERWLLACLLVTAVALYPKGSPVYAITFEDFWHLAPISRLAGSPSPAIAGTFVEPDLAFTHPASGLHFFIAMVVNATGEQPGFVFNKLRSFAGLLAPLFLCLTARQIFARPVTATFAGLGVIVLVLTGSLADTKWHWGQGAPVSHNTDLVMGMVVPGAVWMTLATLNAAPGPRFRWWLAATGAFFLLLVCSHVREGPQVLLYAGMFAATIGLFPRQGRRALLIAGLLATIIFAYQQWHHQAVPQITELVSDHRAALERTMRAMHGADWWRAPVAIYPIQTVWEGWHAVFTLILPLALAWWGRRRQALGVLFGLIAALLLIRVPALSLAVNWATYDEILMFPVRFFTPFSLLVPGALLWGLTVGLRSWWWQGLLALAGVVALIWGRLTAEASITRHPDVFFGLAAVALVFALVQLLRGRSPVIPATTIRGRSMAAVILLVFTGLAAGSLAASPFGWLSGENQASTPTLLRRAPAVWTWSGLVENIRDAPPPGVLAWIRREVPPDEVVISNPAVSVPLTAFIPNPGYGWATVYQLGLWTPLRAMHKESYTRNDGPPLFNKVETPAERRAVCRRVKARLIVLDPSQVLHIKPKLDADPAAYSLCYEERGWYLYRVNPD